MASDNDQSTIEEEFSQSWDFIESFYSSHFEERGEWLLPIFDLTSKLRKQGYDKKLRAGQQLVTLIFSRSREHGLRFGQPTLRTYFTQDGGMDVEYYQAPDVSIELHIDRVALTPELDELIQRLLAQPID